MTATHQETLRRMVEAFVDVTKAYYLDQINITALHEALAAYRAAEKEIMTLIAAGEHCLRRRCISEEIAEDERAQR